MNNEHCLFLLDASSFIYRAFFAYPPLTRKSDGLPVNAVVGFCNMLWSVFENEVPCLEGLKPTHMVLVFDKQKKNFRHEIYPDYKAGRVETPDELKRQFPYIREAVDAFGYRIIEKEGFEADDVIATLATRASENGSEVIIFSSDKDLMQLIDGRSILMVDTLKQKKINTAQVMEKFGVVPEKLVDVQALAGDSVDNIPGVPGIGIKTAADLINQYGDLENLLANAEELTGKKRSNLMQYAEQAVLSKKLATLDRNVPLDQDYQEFGEQRMDFDRLRAFFEKMEFSSMLSKMMGY